MADLENLDCEDSMENLNDLDADLFWFDNAEAKLFWPERKFNNLVDDIREEWWYGFTWKMEIKINGKNESVLNTKVSAEDSKKYKKIKVVYNAFPDLYSEYNLRYNKKKKVFEESNLSSSRKEISDKNASQRINEIKKVIREIKRENKKRKVKRRIWKNASPF